MTAKDHNIISPQAILKLLYKIASLLSRIQTGKFLASASFLAPENWRKKTCASYTSTLRKFLVQESDYTM